MNSTHFFGHLCNEPKLCQIANGKEYCTFTLAVQRQTKKGTVDQIPCVAWGENAKYICRRYHVGDQMLAQGEILSRKQKNTGRKFLEFYIKQLFLTGESHVIEPPPQGADNEIE